MALSFKAIEWQSKFARYPLPKLYRLKGILETS